MSIEFGSLRRATKRAVTVKRERRVDTDDGYRPEFFLRSQCGPPYGAIFFTLTGGFDAALVLTGSGGRGGPRGRTGETVCGRTPGVVVGVSTNVRPTTIVCDFVGAPSFDGVPGRVDARFPVLAGLDDAFFPERTFFDPAREAGWLARLRARRS